MARKPRQTENPPAIVTDADTPGLPEMVDAANQLALRHQERQDAARRVAREIGYELPGGAPDPELIVRDIATHMRRSVEECLEIGRALLVLKEVCEHGEFLNDLETLHFDSRLAQRFMQAARKFSNAALTPHLLEAAGTQTKLLELLVLDDEQIVELEQGQTGELALDDVARMSVTELRRALREERANAEAKERVLADKNQKIDALTARTLRTSVINWPEEFRGYIAQVQVIRNALRQGLASLDAVRLTVMRDHPFDEKPPAEQDAEYDLLTEAHKHFAAELSTTIAEATTMLINVRHHYDMTTGAVTDTELPAAAELI
jgi:hypothetical protein